jgi:hypothetical protein
LLSPDDVVVAVFLLFKRFVSAVVLFLCNSVLFLRNLAHYGAHDQDWTDDLVLTKDAPSSIFDPDTNKRQKPLAPAFPFKKAQVLMVFDFLRPKDCGKLWEPAGHVNGFQTFFWYFFERAANPCQIGPSPLTWSVLVTAKKPLAGKASDAPE